MTAPNRVAAVYPFATGAVLIGAWIAGFDLRVVTLPIIAGTAGIFGLIALAVASVALRNRILVACIVGVAVVALGVLLGINLSTTIAGGVSAGALAVVVGAAKRRLAFGSRLEPGPTSSTRV